METCKATFDEDYDKFCVQKENLVDKESFSTNDVYGLLNTVVRSTGRSYTIKYRDVDHLDLPFIRRCGAPSSPSHEESLVEVLSARMLDVDDSLFQKSMNAIWKRGEKNERFVKGSEKTYSFKVSRAAAKISSEYILSEKAIYSLEVFSEENLVGHDEDSALFDKTPLIEDLRRYIGETILKSIVLIARRESSDVVKKILVTKRVKDNEHYLLDEIGDRVSSKYRPPYSAFNKFNNIICNDIMNFVKNSDFSGSWGGLVYDKFEGAVYLIVDASEKAITTDAPSTTRVGVEGLE